MAIGDTVAGDIPIIIIISRGITNTNTHIIIIIIVVVVTIIRSLSSFGALQNANASLARHGAFGFCA